MVLVFFMHVPRCMIYQDKRVKNIAWSPPMQQGLQNCTCTSWAYSTCQAFLKKDGIDNEYSQKITEIIVFVPEWNIGISVLLCLEHKHQQDCIWNLAVLCRAAHISCCPLPHHKTRLSSIFCSCIMNENMVNLVSFDVCSIPASALLFASNPWMLHESDFMAYPSIPCRSFDILFVTSLNLAS